MKNSIKIIFLFIFIFSILSSCSFDKSYNDELYDKPEFNVYFCQFENCENVFYDFINSAEKELKCAFFELNIDNLINLLDQKSKSIDVELLVDYRYEKYVNHLDFVQLINNSGLMHNKYCVADNERILTGSTNPTNNCVYKNYNNIIIFNSSLISNYYIHNFDEIKNNVKPIVSKNENPYVKVYFCPGNCINLVSRYVREANESIYFMTFSFTAKEIAVDLVLKHNNNLIVKGLFDNLQASSQYSVKHMIDYQEIDYKIAKGVGKLHHKVFIIDEKIVITGSFNPSANANNRNYENILIVYDEEIASKYIQEFNRIYNAS
jgi:phosphatidylserine/phosphatidylglycerophosphate/cardiolipin synthase-like enzyme